MVELRLVEAIINTGFRRPHDRGSIPFGSIILNIVNVVRQSADSVVPFPRVITSCLPLAWLKLLWL